VQVGRTGGAVGDPGRLHPAQRGGQQPAARTLALLPTRELHEIQTRNRLEQQTKDWQRRYAIRAGIEATLSQNVRTCGLRRSRYRGLARTHVQHVLTALACNLTRVADWIATPTTTRHRSTRFHALCTTTA
jgi:hypothetical protein